jgi:hypothetical protein
MGNHWVKARAKGECLFIGQYQARVPNPISEPVKPQAPGETVIQTRLDNGCRDIFGSNLITSLHFKPDHIKSYHIGSDQFKSIQAISRQFKATPPPTVKCREVEYSKVKPSIV